MTIVFGSSIEPGGMDLDDETYSQPCPDCGDEAARRVFERADGGCINRYQTLNCAQCGHSSGDDGNPW